MPVRLSSGSFKLGKHGAVFPGGAPLLPVADPTFAPVAGTYPGAQSVTISTTTPGASIRYTTDGSTPSSTVGTLYSGAVSVAANETLTAIAYKAGAIDSNVVSAGYVIGLIRDTFTDANGTALTAHTMDLGSGWSAGDGTFYIQSNKAQPNSDNHVDTVFADAGEATVDFQVDLTPYYSGANSERPDLVIRVTDKDNLWFFDMQVESDSHVQLYQKSGGGYTPIKYGICSMLSGSTHTAVLTATLRTLILKIDGTEILRYTPVASMATKLGFFLSKNNSPAGKCSWDNVIVTRHPLRFTHYGTTPLVALGAGGSWEDVDVAGPHVFYDTPNSRWVMDYSGFDGSKWCTGLAYATSLAGPWTKEPTNPVFSPTAGELPIAGNGSIIIFGGMYYYYYMGGSGASQSIYCATSPDLLNWTRANSGNPVIAKGAPGQWDQTFTGDPTARLMPDGTTIEVFYTGTGGSGGNGVGRAISTDGVTFTKQGMLFDSSSLVCSDLGQPAPLGDTGTAYSITIDCGIPAGYRSTVLATTADGGATWTFEDVLDGAGSGWESVQVFDTNPVLYNGLWYLFHSGAPTNGSGDTLGAQIGLATGV